MSRIGGIVLCGGKSRRMGRSKAWLPFGSEVLLQRVVRLLSETASPMVVVAGVGQELPELPVSVTVVRDPVPDLGPLQGMAAGLRALADRVELAFVTATDGPFLEVGWVERLAERIGQDDVALPEANGRLHPLSAVYRGRTVLPAAEGLLAEGCYRLLDVLERVRYIRVKGSDLAEVDPDLETLRNLNTPEDYQQALVAAGLERASLAARRRDTRSDA